MAFEIPIPSHQAKFSLTVNLDDTVYRLTFNWNERVEAWYMQVAEQDGTAILSGIKLLPQISLLQRHKDTRLPKGILYAFDVQEGDDATKPSQSELGVKMKLMYITESEVADL